MGGDMNGVLRGVSTFGKGFEKTFSKYTERQQAIEQEQIRSKRDQQYAMDLESIKNSFTEGQNKLDRDQKLIIEGAFGDKRNLQIDLRGSFKEQAAFKESLEGTFAQKEATKGRLNGFFGDRVRVQKWRATLDQDTTFRTQGFWKDRNAASLALAKLNNDQELTLADKRHLHTMIQLEGRANFDMQTKLLLQDGKFYDDVALQGMAQNFSLERMEEQFKNEESIVRITAGLKTKAEKSAAFRSYLYTRMLEGAQEKFKDAQRKKSHVERKEIISLQGAEERRASSQALAYQTMITEAPTMALMMMAAKQSGLSVQMNPVTQQMEIDFESVSDTKEGRAKIVKFSQIYQEAINSNVAAIFGSAIRGHDPTTPEGRRTIDALERSTAAVMGASTTEEAQERYNKFNEEIGGPGQPSSRSKPGRVRSVAEIFAEDPAPVSRRVNAEASLLRRRKADKALVSRFGIGGEKIDTTIGDFKRVGFEDGDEEVIDVGRLDSVKYTDLWEVDKSTGNLKRVGGHLVYMGGDADDILEEADENPDGDLAGLLSLDPINGHPFMLPRSGGIYPPGVSLPSHMHSGIAKLLDEICRHEIEEVTALFDPSMRRARDASSTHVNQMGPKMVPRSFREKQRDDRQTFKVRAERLAELGISRRTPRTKESVRAAILVWISGDELWEAYLKEIGNKRFNNETGKLTPTTPTPEGESWGTNETGSVPQPTGQLMGFPQASGNEGAGGMFGFGNTGFG